jgi:hypothetical protein
MENKKIEVKVHYIAAVKPFQQEYTPEATVGQVKADALNKFGLKEEGNKTFKLFFNKTELTNSDEKLAQVAGDKHELNMDLEEFITQG